MRRALPLVTLLTLPLFALVPRALGRPIYDRGAAGLVQTLQRLQTTASALHTGAHPDDEDSAFIARTARGDHARVAYLSLNRGEGGQNIIGTELFDALGVIRTEELLQARQLDGGQQFFTRTFDYGFSKTLEEASAKWDDRQVLEDMVRVIRTFRPLIVYSRFSGTAADGHGHHQMAGFMTPRAFRAAGDPTQFPEQIREGLRPWQPKKLYRGVGRGGGPAPGPVLQVQEGILDPVVGRTFAEISFEGRSQHKSQEMGTIETRGPVQSGLLRVESLIEAPQPEASIFDGIDTSVPGLARLAGLPDGALRAELAAMDAAARKALAGYTPLNPSALVPTLADGLRATRAARAAARSLNAPADARAEADFLLAFKEEDFAESLARAAGVVVDPLADEETVVQGTDVGVSVRTFLPEGSSAQVTAAVVKAPAGWQVSPAGSEPAGNAGGGGPFGRRERATREERFRVAVPADAPLSQPYFLDQPRRGDSYSWSDDDPKGLPFAPPPLTAEVTMSIGGETITVSQPVMYRFADRVRGELRRNVHVVPAVTVGLDSRLLIVPTGNTPFEQRVVVQARSYARQPQSGTLRLRLPQGWSATPAEIPFSLASAGDRTAATFTVTAPARRPAGSFEVMAVATVGTATFTRDVQEIAYPHIQTQRIFWPATATAQVLELDVAPVSVGYIMGSGDLVPDALRRMRVNVTMIDDEMLATGDLSRFDTIVVGVRASEGRPAFVANHGRLVDYMERGGTLIVQYQQTDYEARNLPPYPAQAPQNSRVTDELAPVRILAPTHPVFTFPNRITTADFDNWVQERNLYAFVSFDERYTPLLETFDRGEGPQRGGQVYARVGQGQYVYTAYSWFRQLPAGVPGAYRQFANLISLARAPRP
ncbi:MAG: PIG-L family deacetylase [Vicinamibacterales bacterium]